MALDWNKEISFGDIAKTLKRGGKGRSSSGYPTKTYINLYVPPKNENDPGKLVLVGILLALIVFAFVKFGVLDQWARVSEKQDELSRLQTQVASVESKLKDYNAVAEEYESFAPLLSASGVDASAVISMIELHVMPSATVASATLEETTLTLELVNVSLDTVGKITNALQSQSIVTSVAVTTAQNDRTDSTSTATLVVSLVGTSNVGSANGDGNFFGIDTNASAEAWADAAGSLSSVNNK